MSGCENLFADTRRLGAADLVSGENAMPNLVEAGAIAVVTNYFQKLGYAVENVSTGKGPGSEHLGYDLVARKNCRFILPGDAS
jgi:hypothetical protein